MGNGLLPQNYYKEDMRVNEQFGGSYLHNQSGTPTAAQKSSPMDFRYGATSRKYDNYMDGQFSKSASIAARNDGSFMNPQNSSFLSR